MEVTLISEKKATLIEVDGLVRISLGLHQHLYAYKVCIGDGVFPEEYLIANVIKPFKK